MIVRKFKWILLLSLHLLSTAAAQNAKSYDTNDWIPITPTSEVDNTKKAQGRVLTLDTPNQNFFPENDYSRKRPNPQQYLRETAFQKGSNVRQTKPDQPYKFEPVLPLQSPQYVQQTQFIQPQQPQFVQTIQPQVAFVQGQVLNQQLVAPPQNGQNYYDTNKGYDLPFNGTFYQSLNPGAINQELVGAIKNVGVVEPTTTTTKPKEEKESVQLLYVPLENLKLNQQVTQRVQTVVSKPTETPRIEKKIPNFQNHKQHQLGDIEDDFIRQALAAHKLQQQLSLGQPLLLQPMTTTAKPRKRKPHQPPLAVFMEKQGPADVKDVLDVLKHAKTISVQDSVGPDTPQVFVGPSNLDSPEGYVKFPLPYLSSVQGNRIERKVEQLPFFVAPLSYKTPEGYSKIPLPSPHVGSVVVATKEELHEKHPEPTRQPQTAQNQIVQDFDVKQPFPQYREEVKTDPYLINQNNPQQNTNGLLGLGNDFLSNFRGNTPQNYETTSTKDFLADYQINTKNNAPQDYRHTPTKDFVPNLAQTYQQDPNKGFITNYQLGLKGNAPQLYQSTPTYQNEPKTNVRSKYQTPNYQSTVKEVLPTQNSKEPISDYDQSNYQIPNYQSNLKETPPTQNSQELIRNYDQNNFQIPNYQSNLKKVLPTQSARELINFQIPNYQSTVKEAPPTQKSKEVIQDYDIPSLPVESKTSFIPSFQLEAKPQINQFSTSVEPSFVTPKSQPNIYTFSEEPIKQTTTSEAAPVVPNQYKLLQNTESQFTAPVFNTRNTQDPFRQVIDQYEIEQINSQFDGKNENLGSLRTTTPAVVSTKHYDDYDVPTTVRSRSRSRHRGRTTTTSTTPSTISDDKYTVLEEFAIQPKTTTPKYTAEVETIPANVYRIQSDHLEPVFIQKQPPMKQHVLNQETLDQQILHGAQPIRDGQFLHASIPVRQNPELQGPPAQIQDPSLSPIMYNRAQNQQEEEEGPHINSYLLGSINNLQDQAVRPLLVPNLLVPTTEKLSTTSLHPTTEEIREIITTEAPRIETTTHRRNRGRVRANSSRYNGSTSSPRRTNRRRPTHTRPTTERQVLRTTTEAVLNYEPTKRTSNHRQRFRTRGRPVPKESSATERILQTTENAFKQPVLEGGFQASAANPPPQSYYQFDHIIENQQVITIKPESASEEKPFKEYHQVYTSQTTYSPEQVPETAGATSKPVVDVQITHSVPVEPKEPAVITQQREEPQFVSRINSNIQSGGVIHNNRHDDSTTRASARVRGRSRNRARFSTTSRPITTAKTTTTTTEKPKEEEEEEEEFYGFIRSPEFHKPSSLVYTTTQQPIQLYSASYQEPPRTLIQLEEEDANPGQSQDTESGSSTPVHFVGQIRPKYTTTESEEPATEAPRFRTRARIRIPNRKATPQPAYNEVKSQKLDDQVTRRSSNVVRSRGRGKNHFKLPESLSPKPDDHDVEGGNYPSAYLKSKDLTTEKPSGFQITIDPYEEEAEGSDQEPHYSLYSPTILKNTDTEWVEASILPSPNDLRIEDKQMYVDSSEEQTTPANDQLEDDIPTTVKTEETTVKRKKGAKRRGVWKLVKQRPVDTFETAESQHYHSVLNSFDETAKKKPSATTTTTTTEASLLDTLYNIFGMASKASSYEEPVNKTTVVPKQEEITTTTIPPTFPEEYTEETTTQEILFDDDYQDETASPETTSTTTTENVVKNYDVEPWNMKEIKTSTTTEVSHETEICFKGKCVKSKEDETNL